MNKAGDEDEDDLLYSDLPNFKYDETIDKLQAANRQLLAKVASLEELIEKQKKETEEYRSQCAILSTNISSLLKTAQNEIKRKDDKISELNKAINELKTKELLSRKRKQNGYPKKGLVEDEDEPQAKQQCLEKADLAAEWRCDHTAEEETEGNQQQEEEKVPQRPTAAPNLKLHTVYSQRMYQRIYQQTAGEIVPLVNDDSGRTGGNPAQSRQQLDTTSALLNSDLLFSVFKNKEQFDSNNISQEEGKCDSKKDSTEIITKEISSTVVNTPSSILSLAKQNCLNKSIDDTKQNNTDIEQKKTIIISRKNRSINFSHYDSKTDDISQPISSNNTLVSNRSLTREKKISNINSPTISTKTRNSTLLTERGPKKAQAGGKLNLFKSQSSNLQESEAQSPSIRKLKKNIISPISGQWSNVNSKRESKPEVKSDVKSGNTPPKHTTENEKQNIMEVLFGSPLKWTENSTDETKQPEKFSVPPTAFEDSCSALIENSKFKKGEHTASDLTQLKDVCFEQKQNPTKPSDQTHWLLKSSNEILQKNITFSSFGNLDSTSEACEPFTSKNNTSSTDNTITLLKVISPKYNDSVLGQFDDTTQLISALAKDHSKLSPIHTPIKEAKLEISRTPPLQVSPLAISDEMKRSQSEKEQLFQSPLVQQAEKQEIDHHRAPGAIGPEEKSDMGTNSLVKTNQEKVYATKNMPPVGKKQNLTPYRTASSSSTINLLEKVNILPTLISSQAQKKQEKKTILLDRPINILCPRKTPRQVSRNKQSAIPSKQSQFSIDITKSKGILEKEQIRSSPNSSKETNHRKTEVSPKDTSNSKENKMGYSNIKGRSSSSEEKGKMSKQRLEAPDRYIKGSPRNAQAKLKKSRSPSWREKSPRRNVHHSPFMKENRKHSSLSSRKESSPCRNGWARDSRRTEDRSKMFKHPRESSIRPNCFFRQTSIERRIAKDYRHSSRVKLTPAQDRVVNNPLPRSKTQIPVIVRSSRKPLWSSTTTSLSVGPKQNLMEWVLRPIDFVSSPSASPKPPGTQTSVPSSRDTTPPSQSPLNQSNIVIVSQRRPVNFGRVN